VKLVLTSDVIKILADQTRQEILEEADQKNFNDTLPILSLDDKNLLEFNWHVVKDNLSSYWKDGVRYEIVKTPIGATALVALGSLAVFLAHKAYKHWKDEKTKDQGKEFAIATGKKVRDEVRTMASEIKAAKGDKEKIKKIKEKYHGKFKNIAKKVKSVALSKADHSSIKNAVERMEKHF